MAAEAAVAEAEAEEEAAARIGEKSAEEAGYKPECDVRGMGPLADLYMLDFFAAALTASLHLLREDAPLADGFAIPPRRTILDTLEACTEVYAGKEHRSLCFHSGYRLLKAVVRELSDRAANAAPAP